MPCMQVDPLTCGQCALAGKQWGLSQYVREGFAQPLSQQETEAAAFASKVYASAVEEAQEPAHACTPAASIGQYLRQRWAEVCRCMCLYLCSSRVLTTFRMVSSCTSGLTTFSSFLSCRSQREPAMPCGTFHQHSPSCACLKRTTVAGMLPQVGQGRDDEQLWAEAWRWRERLQRAIDGCATSDDMGAAGMAEYYELPGPNIPVTPGYSVRMRLPPSMPSMGVPFWLQCFCGCMSFLLL